MPEATPAAPVTPVVAAPVVAQPPAADPKAAAPAVDPKAAPPKPEPAADPMGPRFAALAKETKRLAQEKQALALERTKLQAEQKAKEDALAARSAKADDLEKRLAAAKADPAGFLASVYGDEWYDRLTEVKLTGGKATPDLAVQALREEVQKTAADLRKEQEDFRAKQEEARKQAIEAEKAQIRAQQQAEIDGFTKRTIDFVTANPEKWELINLNNEQKTVPQIIIDTYNKTTERDDEGKVIKAGRLMTPEEAADLVENEIRETLKKNAGTKWWKEHMSAAAPKEEPPSGSAKTLTNALGSEGGTPPAISQDRYALAAAAMEAAYAAGKK